jgi:hypothetical protein
MSDPTVRFTLRAKELQALVALAAKRDYTVSRTLRELVRAAIREDRKANETNDKHQEHESN